MSKPFLKTVLQLMPACWHRGGKHKPLSWNQRHRVPTETRGQQHCRERSLHSKMALPEHSPATETKMHLNSEAGQVVCAAPSALICCLSGTCHWHPVSSTRCNWKPICLRAIATYVCQKSFVLGWILGSGSREGVGGVFFGKRLVQICKVHCWSCWSSPFIIAEHQHQLIH